MGAGGGRRLWIAAVVAGLALFAAACSGGGGGAPGLDEELVSTPGERNMQIPGAGKLPLGATLAVPEGATRPLPAVLIIPAPGDTDRNGPLVIKPPDKLYQELSAALTGAGMVTLRYDHRGVGESQLEEGQELVWDDMVGDAREALAFLSQRTEVDPSRVAVVAHDAAGPIALKLAAADAQVRSVALISSPGRPLVEVWADQFDAHGGPVVAEEFRSMIDGLLATGSLPPRESVGAAFQSLLPPGRDGFFRAMFSVDPLADAPDVHVPVLVVLGERSTSVTAVDAERLGAALGGPSEVVVAANSSPTLQHVLPAPVRRFDPEDHSMHGAGPPVAAAPRDEASMARITSFLAAALQPRQ